MNVDAVGGIGDDDDGHGVDDVGDKVDKLNEL